MEMVRADLLDRRRAYRMGENELVLQGMRGAPRRPVRWNSGSAERAVLAKLAEHQAQTVSRRVLLRHVWKDPAIDARVLDTTVERLRDGLGPPGAALESTTRRGYRLRATEA